MKLCPCALSGIGSRGHYQQNHHFKAARTAQIRAAMGWAGATMTQVGFMPSWQHCCTP